MSMLMGILEQLIFTKVFGLKCRIDFLRQKGLECSIYDNEVIMVTNWSARLENHQRIENLLGVDFLHFLKKYCTFRAL